MREDSDFAAYLAARWPRVVRTLVLLGGSTADAERVARAAFARLRPEWGRTGTDEDPDVHAWRTVLRAWQERPWTGPPGAPSGRLAALEPALDRLTPQARAALVLQAVAGLDPDQVAIVLGGPAPMHGGEGVGEDDLRVAADELEVSPAPTPGAVAATPRAPLRQRAGLPLALGVLVALVLLAGIGSWLGLRSGTPEPRPVPRVTTVEDAAGIAWWAGGTLHLPHVAVALPRVTWLAGVNGGAVVADDAGVVSFVAPDGVVTAVGHQQPGGPLVGSDETGWAGWVDPTGANPRLVVYDVTARAVLAGLALPVGAGEVRPIAFDRGLLYYVDRRGNWQWEPGHDEPLKVFQPGLVDVADATEARQSDPRRLELVQPFFNIVRVVPGSGAELSPDATYALTRQPGTGGPDRFGRVRVYDVRSGEPVWTGLAPRDVVVAATLGPDDEAHYVVARPDYPQADYELRSCDLPAHRCAGVAQLPRGGAPPLLAR